MSLRPYNWSWEQKTEADRRHTLQMRMQVEPWENVSYDYLLAAAEGIDITAEEARTLKSLASCELRTVMNLASVLRKARELAPNQVKTNPVRPSHNVGRKRSGYER